MLSVIGQTAGHKYEKQNYDVWMKILDTQSMKCVYDFQIAHLRTFVICKLSSTVVLSVNDVWEVIIMKSRFVTQLY